MLDAIFERFVKQSPVSVMVRGLMERVFNAEQLDSLFENHARSQYIGLWTKRRQWRGSLCSSW